METADNKTTMAMITNIDQLYESGRVSNNYNHDGVEVNLRDHLNHPEVGNLNQPSYNSKRNSSRHYYQGMLCNQIYANLLMKLL